MNKSHKDSRTDERALNSRVLQYYDETIRIFRVISNGEGKLPYPKMAFIFPTYQCSLNCKNCMYGDYILKCKKKGLIDMDLDLFKHALDDLYKLGIRNVEITGGGEPLNHPKINELIRLIHQYHDKIDFGLLSNGINLNQLGEDSIKLLIESCTYIRLSYSETTSQNLKLTMKYMENLKKLLKYRQEEDYKVKVGAKLLFTHENKHQIPQQVDKLYHLGIGHLKVKSIRSQDDEPTPEDILELEKELNDYKYTSPVKEVLDIDLHKTNYPKDFHCWINPLSTTIDPLGHIYMCYNYHNDSEKMRLGTYTKKNSLTDFWGKKDHLAKIKKINVQKVCKAHNACNCRFADYQRLLEETMIEEKNPIDINKISPNYDQIQRFL